MFDQAKYQLEQKIKWYEPCADLIFDSPRSYSLRAIDQRILKHIPKRFGFFVEAGANDGILQSNSLYFERHRRWRGILIEADPDLAAKCRVTRPRCITEGVALVAPPDSGKSMPFISQGLMGFMHDAFKTSREAENHVKSAQLCHQPLPRKINVIGCTLTDIFEKHSVKKCDLLVLDLEGYESQALMGLDMSKYAPEFIMVEARYPEDILELLKEKYDLAEKLTERDWLFSLKKKKKPL